MRGGGGGGDRGGWGGARGSAANVWGDQQIILICENLRTMR